MPAPTNRPGWYLIPRRQHHQMTCRPTSTGELSAVSLLPPSATSLSGRSRPRASHRCARPDGILGRSYSIELSLYHQVGTRHTALHHTFRPSDWAGESEELV
jgi:hypothetical protein